MKHILRIAVLVCLLGLSLSVNAEWRTDMYAKYDYSTYTNFPDFNSSIEETGFNADLLEAAIFYETNRQRVLNGMPQFKYEYNLEVSAHNHSVAMVQRDFFSHTSPLPGMTSSHDRIKATGLEAQTTGENIALRSISTTYAETAKELLTQWMNSPGHRANILNADFTQLGCGVAFYVGDYNVIYVKATQNFMRSWDEYRAAQNSSRQTSSNQYSQPSQPAPSVQAAKTPQYKGESWTADEIYHANTAYGCTYMSELERNVVMYLNLARLYPKKFAAKEVAPYEHAQGFGVYSTFPEYKQSLLNTMNTMQPIQAIYPDEECYRLAACWAEESSRLGVRGHNRVNCPKGYSAECCSYGVYTAIDIVLQWLIDDGVPSIGHRKICLSSKYSKGGVSFMKHSTEKHTTVLDLK